MERRLRMARGFGKEGLSSGPGALLSHSWLRACVPGGTLAAPPPCACDPFASRRRKRLAMAAGKKGSTANSGAVRAHSG